VFVRLEKLRRRPRALLVVFIFGFVALFGACVFAPAGDVPHVGDVDQRSASAALPGGGCKLPIVVARGHIYALSYVGHTGGLFDLDSGSGRTVISDRLAHSLNLSSRGEIELRGIGSTPERVKETEALHFRFGDCLEFRDESAVVMNLDYLQEIQRAHPSGIIGIELFARFVVELDYHVGGSDALWNSADGGLGFVTLHDPDKFQYRGTGESLWLEIGEDGRPVISGLLTPDEGDAPIPVRLLVDTGQDAFVSFNSPFVKKHRLPDRADNLTEGTATGIGGQKIPTVGADVFKLQFGSLAAQPVRVALSMATAGNSSTDELDGAVGNDFLRRFRVWFDIPHRRIILETVRP
jgi:hypothetical protein